MATYYFHLNDNGVTNFDVIGTDLPDDASARLEARIALMEIAGDSFKTSLSNSRIAMNVTNVDRHEIYQVSLSLESEASN